MKRIVTLLTMVFCFAALAMAEVNLNVDTQLDYQATFNTNSALNNYADLHFNWGALSLSGDITKDVKGYFTVDFTGNSWLTSGIWYSYFDWTLFPGAVFSAGLMDSVFGYFIPGAGYARNIDLGIAWSQNFADIFSYKLQVIKGDLSMTSFDANVVFDGYTLNTTARKLPTAQLLLNLTPLKGLTIGAAGRISTYEFSIVDINTNENFYTNMEIGAEAYIEVGSDLIPGLSLKVDYAALLNMIHTESTNVAFTNTNVNGFYLAADVNYAIGPVTPGVRYVLKDANIDAASTNDNDQWIDIYAAISLTEDGMMKLTPFFQYNLVAAGSSTPENNMWFQLRFEYQFDFPIVKSEEEKAEK